MNELIILLHFLPFTKLAYLTYMQTITNMYHFVSIKFLAAPLLWFDLMKIVNRYMQAVVDEIVFKNVDAFKVVWDFKYDVYTSFFLFFSQ